MHAIQSAVLCPWRAALYIRLSRDDGDKLESNSVTNQREILREHLKLHPDIAIHTPTSMTAGAAPILTAPAFSG